MVLPAWSSGVVNTSGSPSTRAPQNGSVPNARQAITGSFSWPAARLPCAPGGDVVGAGSDLLMVASAGLAGACGERGHATSNAVAVQRIAAVTIRLRISGTRSEDCFRTGAR